MHTEEMKRGVEPLSRKKRKKLKHKLSFKLDNEQ